MVRWGRSLSLVAASGVFSLVGCGAFNPSFLALLDVNGTGQFASIENAPGHNVIAFVNNVTINEQLLSFLESDLGGGLTFTDEQRRNLRPVIRFRILVNYVDGTQQEIQFQLGSKELVQPEFAGQAAQDLSEPNLDNAVVLCDVLSIDFAQTNPIEVYVPVGVQEWELIQATDTTPASLNFVMQVNPQFRTLVQDTPALRSNFSAREAPFFVPNPQCGAVIAFIAEGELSVPFSGERPQPSYRDTDVEAQAGIGGRYSFEIAIR